MEHFVIYLLRATLSLAILHGIYRLFIRTETFHSLNRWVLLGCMALSVALPLVSVPSISRQTAMMTGTWEFSSFLFPVVVTPEGSGASAGGQGFPVPGFWQLVSGLYLLVVTVLLLRLLYQLAGIFLLLRRSRLLSRNGRTLVLSTKVEIPFSFFRYIFMNPRDLDNPESEQILDHEEVHSRELHSTDNLLAELYAIIFWFNPVSWWHKKEVMLNLEYLADRGVLRHGCDRKHYQFQLLKASIHEARYALASHFAQSIIKRRIKMMNTKRSSLKKGWKYLLFIPAAAFSLAVANCSGEMAADRATDELADRSGQSEDILLGTANQNGTVATENVYKFASIDKKPAFPGGNDKILDYVSSEFHYPAEARAAGIEGTVYVQFVIGKDGIVSDVKAVRGQDIGGGLVEEAIRVVSAMPAWTPGEYQGRKVAVSYTLPIFCRLAGMKTGIKVIRYPGGVHAFAEVDKKPQFPGGNDKIMAYIGENFVYPAEAREKGIEGTVYVQFTIYKDGSIAGAAAIRGKELGGGLAEEAERVVKGMPDWTPGENNGEKVDVYYTIPILCRLSK